MQTSADEPQRSGSRWEPPADEQATEVLTPPPVVTPSAPVHRGVSTPVAVLIAVLVGGLGGAVAGVAIAGDRDQQPVSGVVSEQGQPPGAEGQFGVPGQGRHGLGGDHEGEYR